MRTRLASTLALLLAITVICWLVYLTGGTKLAFTHFMYLPIIIAGLLFGTAGGLTAGVLAGIGLGALPLDTATGEPQLLLSALVRMVVFMAVGALTGHWAGQIHRSQAERQQLLDHSVAILVHAIEAGSKMTAGHSLRVAEIAVALGRELRVGNEAIFLLRTGSLLHDIGKLALPTAILEKPGRLTDEEWELVKSHTVEGDRILEGFAHPRAGIIRDMVRHHHERLDGSGYPDGLRGAEISMLTRIVAVADVYEALTSERPYRAAYSPDRALQIIREEADRGRLDAGVVEVLQRLVRAGTVPGGPMEVAAD